MNDSPTLAATHGAPSGRLAVRPGRLFIGGKWRDSRGGNPTGVRMPMIIDDVTPRWADPQGLGPEAIDRYLRSSLNAQDVGLIEPEDVAAVIAFLRSPDAYRVTGEAIDVAAGANVRWNS